MSIKLDTRVTRYNLTKIRQGFEALPKTSRDDYGDILKGGD